MAVYEGTTVTGIAPRRVHAEGGTVSADVVVRATEAYTRDLPGQRRTLLPVYSLMIATEPLPAEVIAGIGVFGGYVVTGVACANLAGRTMAELILETDTERTALPWVGAMARTWEPEPLRWLGVRSSRRILRAADDREFRTDREARAAYRLSRVLRGA